MFSVKGIFFVVLSIFFSTAIGFSGYRVFRSWRAQKMVQEKFVITSIIQTGPEKEALPSFYLEELMELSIDEPKNYYTFDETVAQECLLKSPVIKKARVKKIKPDTVYVDYEVFKPLFLIKDKENLALDSEGNVFPIEPYFSLKRLPECYFGEQKINQDKFDVALAIFSFLSNREAFKECFIKQIDVSYATCESFGKQEVVLLLEEKNQTWYLRLTPYRFPEELLNFVAIKNSLQLSNNRKKVVDLRLLKAAYIEEIPD